MNIEDLFPENERPLDRLVDDGGFFSIFRTVACIGDSLSSGEFQIPKEGGGYHYHDKFEYSWGQFMARAAGNTVYNFSTGGMTAKEYIESFAEKKGFWDPDLKCQAYIIVLGVNDLFSGKKEPGSLSDIAEDWRNNKDTFVGYYAAIVQRYKEIAPNAKFFFVTTPREHTNQLNEISGKIRDVLEDLTGYFSNSYLIDLYRYAPAYDNAFREKFFLCGHMNPMGYALTAKMIMSYIDFIIRTHMEDFNYVGYINTPQEPLVEFNPKQTEEKTESK